LQPESVCTILRLGLEDQSQTPDPSSSSSLSVKHAALRACVAYIENLDSFPGTQGAGAGAGPTSNIHPSSRPISIPFPPIPIPIPIPNPPPPNPNPALPTPNPNILNLPPPLLIPSSPNTSLHFPSNTLRASFTEFDDAVAGFGYAACGGLWTYADGGETFSYAEGFFFFCFRFWGDSPSQVGGVGNEDEEEDLTDLQQTLRLTALEFMLALTEARPGLVRRVQGWVEVLVRACLEGMGEIEDEDQEGEGEGNDEDGGGDEGEGERGDELDSNLPPPFQQPTSNSSSTETDSPPALYEQSLDRLAVALGGRYVLPPAFQYIPSMLLSYDWRVRHAGLMAIAAVGEGTGKVMVEQLGRVVDGQLCTDLEEIIQERYHVQLFGVLIPALEDPEPRVHAHAAAALINFCEGVARDTLVPYLDPIVERLLRLLNPDVEDGENTNGRTGGKKKKKRYVQEQAITSLAMVADASEGMFAKYYGRIMPLLLDVLRNAEGTEYKRLRVKAMECAGLVAIAVGRDIFRPDAATLVELLVRIQNPTDTQLGHYLISTWAKTKTPHPPTPPRPPNPNPPPPPHLSTEKAGKQ
ncbi:hypothetical protein H0H93_006907, partial [Arthromyces matolae]